MHGNRSEFGHRGLPALAAGLDWNVRYGANSALLEVAAAGLAGGYNGDGTVDAADYDMWSGVGRPRRRAWLYRIATVK